LSQNGFDSILKILEICVLRAGSEQIGNAILIKPEYWSIGVLGFKIKQHIEHWYFHHSITPKMLDKGEA